MSTIYRHGDALMRLLMDAVGVDQPILEIAVRCEIRRPPIVTVVFYADADQTRRLEAIASKGEVPA